MLEIVYFLQFCCMMLASIYVTLFVSWSYKIVLLFLYFCKRNKKLVKNILNFYLLEYKENDIACIMIQSLYIPLYLFHYIDIISNILYDICVSLYQNLKSYDIFKVRLQKIEQEIINLNSIYLIKRNEYMSILFIHMKNIVLESLSHNNININDINLNHSHSKSDTQNKMRGSVHKNMQRLREKRKNKLS